jgi:transcription initiation factor TFIIH subunit 4
MPSTRSDDAEDKNLDPILAKPHALLPFLQLQSATALSRLYQSPSSCLSIFRSIMLFNTQYHLSDVNIRLLDAVERQLVMNLLWLDSAISLSTMVAWVIQDKKKYASLQMKPTCVHEIRVYDDALDMLSKLHILHINLGKLSLKANFKTSLRHAITGG